MASELANETFTPGAASSAIAAARVRVAVTFVVTLAMILLLAGVIWVQVAARFDTERMRTEGETMRNAMSGMLSMGLPLADFIGFQAVSGRILRENPTIRAVVVRDQAGRIALSRPEGYKDALNRPALSFPASATVDDTALDESGPWVRLAKPIFNRFGPIGSLELAFERSRVSELTRNAAIAGLAAIVLLATGLTVHSLAIANPEFFQSRREMIGVYAMVGLLGIILTASALIGLTAEKAEETASSYAHSLGARLSEAVELGISPDDLSGLDEVVREYRESNSIIGYVALLEGNRIATGTGFNAAGSQWEHPTGYFDAIYEVRPRRLYTPQYRVLVGIRWQTALRTLAEATVVPIGILLLVLTLGTIAISRFRVQDRA